MAERFTPKGELIIVTGWLVGMLAGYLLMLAAGLGGIIGGAVQIGGLGAAGALVASSIARKLSATSSKVYSDGEKKSDHWLLIVFVVLCILIFGGAIVYVNTL